MLVLVYLIPVITCLILLLFFRVYVVWWEYLVVLLPSLMFSSMLYFGILEVQMTDTEYLGYYVTRVEYYEDWNEWVHQTCTRTWTDSKGNTHTETYDCSHSVYHPEHWEMYLNDEDLSYTIYEDYYNSIVKKFGKKPRFVDLHRHYYTNDGDMYVCTFDGNRNRLWPITFSNKYKNKILGSKSIFNFSEVSKEEKEENGLYDYPAVKLYDQEPILAENFKVPTAIVDSFKYLNAIYGYQYKFRVYVMIFLNKERDVAKLQQDYFVGGNLNELLVCIGVDDSARVNWVESFSWEDEPVISVGVNHLYHSGEPLKLLKLNRYLIQNVPRKWVKKSKKDFEYISVDADSSTWTWILILTVILNIVTSVYVIKNEFS